MKGEVRGMAKNATGTVECGKFKVELKGVGKRVVVLPLHITLDEVHEVVQRLFGWADEHLWEFLDADGRSYGYSGEDGVEEVEGLIAPSAACLSDLLPEQGWKLMYDYDFAAGWQHVITRMADPKTPGRRCVQTSGPDGIEDCGGPRELRQCKKQWHVPTAEEITQRLDGLKLHPRKSGLGRFTIERAALEPRIRELDDLEWEWLRQLGEGEAAQMWIHSPRLESLVRLLPGVRSMPKFLEAYCGEHVYEARPEFCRLWRKKREAWAQLRAGAEDVGAEADDLPRDLWWSLLDFVRAAACLYGAVDAGEVCELFDHWRDQRAWLKTATRETAEMGLQLVRRSMFAVGAVAYFRDGRAISTAKYPPDEASSDAALAETLELRKGKKRWHPESYDKFISYIGAGENLPAEYDSLKRFLLAGWQTDSDGDAEADAKWACVDVYNAFSAGHKWQVAFDRLRNWYEMSGISEETFGKIVTLLAKVSNATPHDANWGYTPNAMTAMHGLGGVIDWEVAPYDVTGKATIHPPTLSGTVKVGRNDPCPCGSGKKFKKCCGRPQ